MILMDYVGCLMLTSNYSMSTQDRTREDKYQKLNRNKGRNVAVRAMSLYCYCKDTLVRTKQLRF